MQAWHDSQMISLESRLNEINESSSGAILNVLLQLVFKIISGPHIEESWFHGSTKVDLSLSRIIFARNTTGNSSLFQERKVYVFQSIFEFRKKEKINPNKLY